MTSARSVCGCTLALLHERPPPFFFFSFVGGGWGTTTPPPPLVRSLSLFFWWLVCVVFACIPFWFFFPFKGSWFAFSLASFLLCALASSRGIFLPCTCFVACGRFLRWPTFLFIGFIRVFRLSSPQTCAGLGRSFPLCFQDPLRLADVPQALFTFFFFL